MGRVFCFDWNDSMSGRACFGGLAGGLFEFSELVTSVCFSLSDELAIVRILSAFARSLSILAKLTSPLLAGAEDVLCSEDGGAFRSL